MFAGRRLRSSFLSPCVTHARARRTESVAANRRGLAIVERLVAEFPAEPDIPAEARPRTEQSCLAAGDLPRSEGPRPGPGRGTGPQGGQARTDERDRTGIRWAPLFTVPETGPGRSRRSANRTSWTRTRAGLQRAISWRWLTRGGARPARPGSGSTSPAGGTAARPRPTRSSGGSAPRPRACSA